MYFLIQQIDHEKNWLTLNYDAIGIEMESDGYIDPLNHGDQAGTYTTAQIKTAKKFVKTLCQRYHIPRSFVLAHSDISPYRVEEGKVILGKNDPSESFPWEIYVGKKSLIKEELNNKNNFLIQCLTKIGYDLNRDNSVSYDQQHLVIKYCVLAFARHWSIQDVNFAKKWDGLDYNQIPIDLLKKIKWVAHS